MRTTRAPQKARATRWIHAGLATVLAAMAPAQEPAEQPAPPPEQKPVQQPVAEAEAGPEAKPQGELARVKVAELSLRCFATEHSPHYEDLLAEGAAVRVGERYGGFRRVLLPLGPVGYVHKRFASEPAGGKVTTVGKGVSFRYRPKSAEAPVAALPEGTELWVLGEEGDWWKVRWPEAEAWAPEGDLEVFAEPNETLELAYAELAKTHRAAVDELVAAQEAAAAAAKALAEQKQALAELVERYRQETARPVREQDYTALAADVEAFLAAAPEELQPPARDLRQNIERMQWAVEATMVVQEEPVPHRTDPELVQPEKPDSLARFSTIGWLRYHPGRAGPARYTVEKGGQVLFWVTCSSGRYDLRLFADKELGLVGPAQRPSPDSMRVLDVERIEVLGVPRE